MIFIDARHEMVALFYQHLGFNRLPATLLLVHKFVDIAAALTP